jgi:hypothetical protein
MLFAEFSASSMGSTSRQSTWMPFPESIIALGLAWKASSCLTQRAFASSALLGSRSASTNSMAATSVFLGFLEMDARSA